MRLVPRLAASVAAVLISTALALPAQAATGADAPPPTDGAEQTVGPAPDASGAQEPDGDVVGDPAALPAGGDQGGGDPAPAPSGPASSDPAPSEPAPSDTAPQDGSAPSDGSEPGAGVAPDAAGTASDREMAATATRSLVVSGRVVLQGGGTGSISVDLLAAPDDAYPSPDSMSAASATVGADGRYSLSVEVPDATRLYLRAKASSPAHVPQVVVGAGGTTSYSYLSLASLPVDGGSLDLGTTTVPRRGALAVTASRPVDAVRLTRLDGSEITTVWANTARTGFSFTGLYPGRYKVVPLWGSRAVAGTSTTVTVTAGVTARASAAITTPSVLTGTVKDSAGKAVPGIAVYASRGSTVQQTLTAANGSYTFRGLTAGTYKVEYSGASGSTVAARKYVTATGSATVSAARTTTANRAMTVGATIKLSVRHQVKGDVQIVALTSADNALAQTWSTSTGAATKAVTLQGLPSGTYDVVAVETARHRYVTKRVTVTAGRSYSAGTLAASTPTVTVAGKLAGTTTGSVTLGWGSGARPAAGGIVSSTGAYRITDVVPGRYGATAWRLTTSGTYGWAAPRPLTVTKSATVNLPQPTTVLSRRIQVAGVVTYRGLPVEQAAVGAGTIAGDLTSGATTSTGATTLYWDGSPVRLSVTGGYGPLLGGYGSPLYLSGVTPASASTSASLRAIGTTGVGGA